MAPIKPDFLKEREQKKATDQVNKEVKQTEKTDDTVQEQGKKKNRKLLAVCLITALLMCIFGYILINVILPKTKYGRNTTAVSVNTVRDISAESKSTKTSDNLYQREADALWRVYKDEFSCDSSTFKSEYIQLREAGNLKSDSFYELESKYMKLKYFDTDATEQVSEEEENIKIKQVPTANAESTEDITVNEEELANLDSDYPEEDIDDTESTATEGNSEGFCYKELDGFSIE